MKASLALSAARAERLKLTFGKIEVQGAGDIDRAIREAAQNGLEAVIVGQSPMFFIERSRIAQLAIEHRLPTLAAAAEFTAAGVLASYGTKLVTIFGKAPAYVDKILKGQKPAEIPVEQPTTFELIVNLTTAKTIGFEVPPTILTRADRVIE